MDVTHAGGVFDFLTSETRSPGLAVFNLRAKAQTLGLGTTCMVDSYPVDPRVDRLRGILGLGGVVNGWR